MITEKWQVKLWLFAVCCLPLTGFAANVGDFVSYTQSGNQIDIAVSNGAVRIIACDTNVFRVSFDTRSTDRFTAVQGGGAGYCKDVLWMADLNSRIFPDPGTTVTEDSATLAVATSALVCKVQKSPLRLYWYRVVGMTEITHDSVAMNNTGSSSGSPALTFYSGANEHYFGWGAGFEHYMNSNYPIDKKGVTYSCRRSMAHFMYSTGGYGIWCCFQEPYPPTFFDPSSCTTGTGFSISSGSGIVKYWMNPTTEDNTQIMPYLSYFFIAGNWKAAMKGYTLVSGRPPRLGKKYYGIMRDMYPGPGTPVAFARFARWDSLARIKKLNMDWFRMDNFFDWTNLCNTTIPGTCWNSGIPAEIQNYRSAGFYFGGMSVGWGYYGCCGSGCTNYVCQSQTAVQAALNNGYDWPWYLSMGCYQARWQARDQWSTWVQAHNAVKGTTNGEIYTMISRGWMSVGSQAWPGGHLGDYLGGTKHRVHSSQLEEALAGYAYSHCDLAEGRIDDVYGYAGFYLRPMYTINMAGAAGNGRTDFPACIDVVENYSGTGLQHIQKWGNRHYRFIPYLFTYGMIAHEQGVPVTRGMMCQDSGEWNSNCWTQAQQSYVGENIIWAPAYPGTPGGLTSRNNIYLPSGVWYDFWPDGGQPQVSWTGPTTIASYALGSGTSFRCPTFVRANSIVPLMDSLQYIGEKPESTIWLYVWPTDGTTRSPQNGSFTLYEDEGSAVWNTTYGWSEGYTTEPSRTVFNMNYYDHASQPTTVINIGPFSGSRYCSAASQRRYRVVAHCLPQPIQVRSGTTAWSSQITQADIDAGTEGWYYDASNGGKVYVNAAGSAQNNQFEIVIGPEVSINPAFNAVREQQVIVKRRSGAIEIKVPFPGNHTVEILNLQGRLVARRGGNTAANYSIPLSGRPQAIYLIRIITGGRTVVRKMML